MLDDKKIEEIKSRAKQFIIEGTIKKGISNKDEIEFFIGNSQKSLSTAQLLYDVSTNIKMQETYNQKDFDGFLWVINTSYYSMFYITRAILEKDGIKLKGDLSIHMLTFDALAHYFYFTGKLQKQLMEAYAEAEKEASELLGKEKAHTLVEDYFNEKEKRGRFTYHMGEKALQSKAKTSLDRAKNFFEEIRTLIVK